MTARRQVSQHSSGSLARGRKHLAVYIHTSALSADTFRQPEKQYYMYVIMCIAALTPVPKQAHTLSGHFSPNRTAMLHVCYYLRCPPYTRTQTSPHSQRTLFAKQHTDVTCGVLSCAAPPARSYLNKPALAADTFRQPERQHYMYVIICVVPLTLVPKQAHTLSGHFSPNREAISHVCHNVQRSVVHPQPTLS